MARTVALNNENLKPSVSSAQASFTIDDNSALASTDPYVALAVNLVGYANLIVYNVDYGTSGSPGLLLDSESNLWSLSKIYRIAFTTPTITLKHDATPDGTLLRAVLIGHSSPNVAQFKLVTDNAGAGPTSFQTSDGLNWFVDDVDASTPGYQVKFDETGEQLMINASGFTATCVIIEPFTGNAIELLNSGGAGPDVYIDPTDAAADRLNANLTGAADSSFSLANTQDTIGVWDTSTQVLPVYVVPGATDENRVQHAFPFLPRKIYVQNPTSNLFFPVAYNANAAADGFPLRALGGSPFWDFAYDNTSTGTDTDTSVSTASDLRPSQDTKL